MNECFKINKTLTDKKLETVKRVKAYSRSFLLCAQLILLIESTKLKDVIKHKHQTQCYMVTLTAKNR